MNRKWILAGLGAIVVAVAFAFFAVRSPLSVEMAEPVRHGGAASEGSEPPIASMAPPEPAPSAPVVAADRANTAPAVSAPVVSEPSAAVSVGSAPSPDDTAIDSTVTSLEPPAPFGEDETHREVEIYIATNRTLNPDSDPDDPATTLTEVIGDLHYGTAIVSIPRVHKMGQLESQNWFAAQIFDPDEEKHVFLQDVSLWSREEVLQFMDDQIAGADGSARGGRSIMMYVHGFNTSFDKAARRAGQLTYDLTWDGPSVLFSWPSQGSALDYFKDSTNAEDSVPAMKQVLRDLADRNADRVIVIAHSMGTRIISNAMKELVLADDPLVSEIDMVILAAPDINARTFREQIAPRFRDAQLPVTLYASAEDSALKASKKANGFRRIGDTTDGVPLVDGIHVVDATGAVSDFFGHTYFGDNTSILSDIYQIVHTTTDPFQRSTLLPVPPQSLTQDAITHWQINLAN